MMTAPRVMGGSALKRGDVVKLVLSVGGEGKFRIEESVAEDAAGRRWIVREIKNFNRGMERAAWVMGEPFIIREKHVTERLNFVHSLDVGDHLTKVVHS